jgi:hypothetical protein
VCGPNDGAHIIMALKYFHILCRLNTSMNIRVTLHSTMFTFRKYGQHRWKVSEICCWPCHTRYRQRQLCGLFAGGLVQISISHNVDVARSVRGLCNTGFNLKSPSEFFFRKEHRVPLPSLKHQEQSDTPQCLRGCFLKQKYANIVV